MADILDRLKTALADRYEIERELGSGGMATVYLAYDLKHHRRVAVKVLRPDLAAALGAGRFLREIEIAANLTHPHILPLHDSGEADGFLFYVMPFIEGESLRDRINREKQLSIGDALKITCEVADALGSAHRHNVIHRDIKPENVLIEEGHAVVADFGVARAISAAAGAQLTETGIAVGTPAYMSPEQASGEVELDGRSDIYSLGCVLYEMLGGEPPYTGPTPQAVIAKKLSEPTPRISVVRELVPQSVEGALDKALAKTPADRFDTAAELVSALTAARQGISAPTAAPRRKVPIVLLAVVGAVAAIMAVAIGVWLARPEPEGPPRLVVLPFENLGAPEDEYFADGISEEITARLARAGGMSLISRTSAMRYKGSDKSLEQIGRELGVQYVLEGTIRWQKGADGGRVRVTPQLIRISDDSHLWADIFDEPLTEIFAMQSSVALQVVDALGVVLSTGGESVLTAQPTTDLEAYEAYLKGRYFWNRRTEPALETALGHFKEAIQRDSTFALAHAGLADTYLVLYALGFRAPAEALECAQAAAEFALRMDSSIAEPRASLGMVRFARRDWSGAETELVAAIALNPGYATAHHWYAELLLATGRPEEALSEVEQARALDPLSPIIITDVAEKLVFLQRYDEALEACQEANELNPNLALTYIYLGRIYLFTGDRSAALRNFETAVQLTGGSSWYVGWYGYALAVSGDRRGALAQLDSLRSPARTGHVAALDSANIHLGLGNKELAISSLERALDDLSYPALFLGTSRIYDGLRNDPRFQELLRRMNFPES